MLFYIFLTTLALTEGYVSNIVDEDYYEREYQSYQKKPSTTVELGGPFEAHCLHLSKKPEGGMFAKDTEFVSLAKLTVDETVLLDRYIVDDCRKMTESIVKVTSSSAAEGELPGEVEVVYRTWDDTEGTAHKLRVKYVKIADEYARVDHENVKKILLSKPKEIITLMAAKGLRE